MPETAPVPDLSAAAEATLRTFVADCQQALGRDLESIVLFGSAAEGRLRPTSDVNVLVVLGRFVPSAADALRAPMRLARAAIGLRAMFLLAAELPAAARAFALKFDDVLRRHRLLYGKDPFAALEIERGAVIVALRQHSLNLVLRLRARYVLSSQREEQIARVLAETAGPLRAAAATLLQLEGKGVASPKAALEQFVRDRQAPEAGDALRRMSQARQTGFLPAGTAIPAFVVVLALAERLHRRAEELTA
jgi:predicted nucleotidyltransferase